MTTLNLHGQRGGVASDINDAMIVAGSLRYSYTDWGAVLWDGANVTELGSGSARAINNSGLVVGENGSGYPARWEGGVLTVLPGLGTTSGSAAGLNDRGQAVGYSNDRACLWEGNTVTPLDGPGVGKSWAYAVNNAALAVGEAYFGGGSSLQGFVWESGTMHNLNDLLVNGQGWDIWTARGISDTGLIVGEGYAPDGQSHAYLLTPIPEPASLCLLALGGLALLTRRRRRQPPSR
jgi:uncharacterized membrane protein